jgi:hypothetical protein
VAVVGSALLITMGRTDTRIQIEHDYPRRAAAMSAHSVSNRPIWLVDAASRTTA